MAPKSRAKAKPKSAKKAAAKKAAAKRSVRKPKKAAPKARAKTRPAAAKKPAPRTGKPAIAAKSAATPGAPKGYRSVTPYLAIENAANALEFYSKAFGAKEVVRLCLPDGKVCHAEIRIGDSMIMLSEDAPEMNGGKSRSPLKLGNSSVSVHLYVPDVDESFDRAVGAGCTAMLPPSDMFWGDRFSMVVDPYGHMWSIATNVKELSPAELERGMKEWMDQMAQCAQQPVPAPA
jgi:PhnB protein